MTTEEQALRSPTLEQVESLLDNTLGAFPKFRRNHTTSFGLFKNKSPFLVGLMSGLAILTLIWLPLYINKSEPHLVCLCAFGGVYLFFAVMAARSTSRRLLDLIRDIIPQLSQATLTQIESRLQRRFSDTYMSILALLVAAAGTLASAIAIQEGYPGVQLTHTLWSCIEWFVIYATAARATYTGRFYSVFSDFLDQGNEKLYALSPARSQLILDIAALGRIMLLFWLSISATIALMIPFLAVADMPSSLQYATISKTLGHALSCAARSSFVWVVMPISIFFSGVFGTVVFLQNERDIRRAVDREVRRSLIAIERSFASISRGNFYLPDSLGKEVDRLVAQRAELMKYGRYSSLVVSGFSLMIPLIGSIVPLVRLLIGPAISH